MGKRGPSPAPVELKLLRGNPGRRPVPLTLLAPRPPEPPPPPDFLSDYALAEWRKVAPQLFAMRLLTVLDRAALAAYAESYATWRTAAETLALMASGDPVTHGLLVKGPDGVTANPLVGIARRAAADMVRFAGEFGMSPSARARIAAGPFESATPRKFAGLLAGYDDERA